MKLKSHKLQRFVMGFLMVLLAACESNPPAPVIDRTPQAANTKPPPQAKPVAAAKDWRPDSHIVKKGETLFSIGLEYGLDYKEIAAANNIAAPYPIQVGQKIDLSNFKTKTAIEAKNTEDGVVITPMKTEPAVVGDLPVETKPTVPTTVPTTVPATVPVEVIAPVPAITPVLSEPKAVREPYSLEALNRTASKIVSLKPTEATATQPVAVKPAEIKPVDAKPVEAKPMDTTATGDESIAWAWPTQGKVVAGFNDTSNRGLDIAGKTGQTINAASSGKVIYSGSDLRGYGKLVIV